MIIKVNGLPCDICGAAIRHVPNCKVIGGTYDISKEIKKNTTILNNVKDSWNKGNKNEKL